MKKFLLLTLLGCSLNLYAVPYFSEYHENFLIIVFTGDVNEQDIPQIKILERRYIESMSGLVRPSVNVSSELEKLGVQIQVMRDDRNVLPKGQPIQPQQRR